MKTIKYILFLFLFITVSCKTSNVTKERELSSIKKDTNNLEVSVIKKEVFTDFDKDGVLDINDKCPEIEISCIVKPENIIEPENILPDDKLTSNKRHFNKLYKIKEIIQDSQYLEGLIVYKVPKEMVVGNSYVVKIRITRESNKTILVIGDRKIPIADDDNSIVSIEEINVSPIMSANLIVSKNSFRIDILSTEYQNISERGYTEWAWNIIPLKGGDNLLKLNVKIRVKEDGESYYKDIVVFDRKIKVKSNIKFSIITWFSEYWQWLFGFILIPLIKWLYDEWKKKKELNREKM